jgi:hypothetical protein
MFLRADMVRLSHKMVGTEKVENSLGRKLLKEWYGSANVSSHDEPEDTAYEWAYRNIRISMAIKMPKFHMNQIDDGMVSNKFLLLDKVSPV